MIWIYLYDKNVKAISDLSTSIFGLLFHL